MDMNKPVALPFAWYCAWLGKDDEPVWEQYEECHPASKEWDNFPDKIIPLYTHPVKENCCPDCGCHFTGEYPFNYTVKALTDEEILNVAFCSEISTVSIENDWGGTVLEFARAILRKAQEK